MHGVEGMFIGIAVGYAFGGVLACAWLWWSIRGIQGMERNTVQ